MGISFGSINTGLPKDIVQQIINAEKAPIQRLEQRKTQIDSKKKLLGELMGYVQEMRGTLASNSTERNLRELKVMFNDEIVHVDVDKIKAEPGSYQFEVDQMARKSSAMSSGFSDPDESYVGVGYIQYHLPNGETRDIYIDSENSSLNKIAKQINKENLGAQASVVNDGTGSDSPWRLILSIKETGDVNLADFPYFYFVDGENDFYLEYEREAHDSLVKLDGFEIEGQSNKFTELIPGLTIDLKKAKPGEEFTIQVVEDVQAVTDKIKSIIDNINKVLGFIRDQNNLNEKSNTLETLGGDITLQTLESRLRATIFTSVETDFGNKRLGDLGVAFQKDGTIKMDDKIFTSKLSENWKLASQILVGRMTEEGKSLGFIDRLSSLIDGTIRSPDGILTTRKNGLDSKTQQIDRQIENKQRMIDKKESMLKDKFARLEGTISKIRNQGSGLAAMASGMQDPVTQLG